MTAEVDQRLILAVDGGNAKTDLALLDAGGELRALVRGGGSNTHYLGVDGAIERIERLLQRAAVEAGLDRPFAATAQIMLAGADLPDEMGALRAEIERQRWSRRLAVGNDTEALLRTGSDRGWGVAVVCGAGINCLGLAPDGRDARFLSLGEISGDWGGGADVGMAALFAAARGADGRGPRTVLENVVAAHFGFSDPLAVSRGLHLGEIPVARLAELAPAVLAAYDSDPVAARIVNRLADEVIAFVRAVVNRLGLADSDPDVVLGGRLLQAAASRVGDRIVDGVGQVAPRAHVLVAPSEPIVGAALLGLDALGADAHAIARARSELDAAVRDLAPGHDDRVVAARGRRGSSRLR